MTFLARASQRAVSCRQIYRVLLMSLLQRQVKRLANKRRRDNTLIREENSIDRERKEEERAADYMNNKHVLYIVYRCIYACATTFEQHR